MAYTEEFMNSKGEKIQLTLRFHRESRMTYQIEDFEQLFEDDFELLKRFLGHHQQIQVPRLQELYDYAEGNNHEVLKDEHRRQETDMADSRAVHNFGQKISKFRQGYLVGNPVTIEYQDKMKHSPTDLALEELSKQNSFNELNRNLILDLSQVGRAFEIAYFTDDEELKVSRLDPRNTFMIYDRTIDKQPLVGVRYYHPDPFNKDIYTVEVYGKNQRYYYVWDSDGIREKNSGSNEQHLNGFGDVQIIEHLNNDQGIGDYETELPLIDLYDAAQSDTANYMADLADAILVIYGNIDFPDDVDTPEKQMEYMKMMRKARLMQLIPPEDIDGKEKQVSAEYLYKRYDVSGTEAYKTRLDSDIHELTSTPKLSDEHFSGNQTGEAMKYKLFGLDQERVSTQALFEKGLRRRYQLLATIYPKITTENNQGAFVNYDNTLLKVDFTPNLPESDTEVVNIVKQLYGLISDETLFGILEVVTNVKAEEEKRRLETEEPEDILPRFTNQPNATDDEEINEEDIGDDNGESES